MLNAHVLLLNQSYEPITICTAKKAVILLFLEKAELVTKKEELTLHSAASEFPWPSVIRLRRYQRVPFKRIILNRKNVLKRDRHKCGYCGRGDLPLTVDHIIPRARGGENSWENLVAACWPCNNRKGDRLLKDTNFKLKIKPYKPNHITFIKNRVGRIDSAWEPFIFH